MARGGVYGSMLTGNWSGFGAALGRLAVDFPNAMNGALVEEGEFYRRKMVEGITEQSPGGQPFKPLSPVTLALRKLAGFRGTKALIRTGWLRQSITVLTPNPGLVFVGIPYTARDPSTNRRTADIARLHEFGGTIRSVVSKARMRAIVTMLRKAGLKGNSGGQGGGGGGAGITVIPARPFIRPVFSMYGGRRGAERYQARVARKLGGLLGVINHPDLGGHGQEQMAEKFLRGEGSKGVSSFRKGVAGQQGKTKGAMQMFRRTFGVRGGAKTARKARGAARGPKLIQPKLPGIPKPRRGRAGRPRALRQPKTPKMRTPRTPKAQRPPKLRAPKPYANPAQKQAASFAKKLQSQQARSAKNVARAQARKSAQQARAKLRLGKSAQKVGRRVAREQRSLDRAKRQSEVAQRKAARLAKRQARAAAKQSRGEQRERRSMEKAMGSANKWRRQLQREAQKQKRSSEKDARKQWRAEKKSGMHQPHTAHIKAFRSRQRGQRADAHVRAYRKQKKG